MRLTKVEELKLVQTALEALRKTKHSRIMRNKAEAFDGRQYIVLCDLLARVDEQLEQVTSSRQTEV